MLKQESLWFSRMFFRHILWWCVKKLHKLIKLKSCMWILHNRYDKGCGDKMVKKGLLRRPVRWILFWKRAWMLRQSDRLFGWCWEMCSVWKHINGKQLNMLEQCDLWLFKTDFEHDFWQLEMHAWQRKGKMGWNRVSKFLYWLPNIKNFLNSQVIWWFLFYLKRLIINLWGWSQWQACIQQQQKFQNTLG